MCIKHLGLLTKYVTCSESFEGNSFSNPIEARCCVTPKKRMNKEDVVANVWPKHLLCSLDIPDASFFLCCSLTQDERRGHVIA